MNMTAEQVVGGGHVSPDQMMELYRQFKAGTIRRNRMTLILDHKDAFNPRIVRFDWEKIYMLLNRREQYEREGLRFAQRDNPKWDIIVLKDVSIEEVAHTFKTLDVRIRWEISGTSDLVNSRSNKEWSYGVSCTKSLNGDSTSEVRNSMTLLERTLLELAYYVTTGDHLEVDTTTMCSGSSFNKDKKVPFFGYSSRVGGIYISSTHNPTMHQFLGQQSKEPCFRSVETI